jgi:WD40 repeat protein
MTGLNSISRNTGCAMTLGAALIVFAVPAAAQPPQPVAPYSVHVFATGVVGSYTQPDSIALSASGRSVFIGFGNSVAKDGTDGKSSTIVEFTLDGHPLRQFSVKGHNDGLKLDPRSGRLWALQNEDGNPNLVIIDPEDGTQTPYAFAPTAHGGGYDDIVFHDGHVFLSASNPSSDPNTAPAIVTAELEDGMVEVHPVIAGNAVATNISTNTSLTLNLQDPDSMTWSPDGSLLLVSQADAELIFVQHPGQQSQRVFQLALSSGGVTAQADDTVFASGNGFILVSDLDANTVYQIDQAFWPGQVPYSAANVLGLVGRLDLETGNLIPVVTGFKNPRGMSFVRPRARGEEEERGR